MFISENIYRQEPRYVTTDHFVTTTVNMTHGAAEKVSPVKPSASGNDDEIKYP
jgi:hypothetical protein